MDQEDRKIYEEMMTYVAQAIRLAYFEGYTKAINDGDSHSPLKAAQGAEQISTRLAECFKKLNEQYDREDVSDAN